MKHIIDELYDLKEAVSYEIGEANKRIKNAGGKISTSDLDVIDKLTHSMKSLITACAMLEAEEDGYSGDYYARDDGARRGGRTGYSGTYMGYNRKYSRGVEWNDRLRQMMDEAPDEQTRMDIKRMMDRANR